MGRRPSPNHRRAPRRSRAQGLRPARERVPKHPATPKDERGADKGAEKSDDTEEDRRRGSPAARAAASSGHAPWPRPSQPVPPCERSRRSPKPAPTVVHDPMGDASCWRRPVPGRRRARAGCRGSARTLRRSRSAGAPSKPPSAREQLAQDRLPREAKRRGAGREKRWEEFRAAIENSIVGAGPEHHGPQCRGRSVRGLPGGVPSQPVHASSRTSSWRACRRWASSRDPNLVTKVEIVLNSDGSLDRVGVVKSSGNIMYDFGAFNAVQRGAPYPVPPEKIRSPDGRVYIVWALHRNESQWEPGTPSRTSSRTRRARPTIPSPTMMSPYRPSAPTGGDPRDARARPRAGEGPEGAPKFVRDGAVQPRPADSDRRLLRRGGPRGGPCSR